MSSKIDLLLEKFLTAYNVYGHTKEIFENPTKKEMREIANSRGELRFIADKKRKKVYIFSVDSYHRSTWDEHISKELGDSRRMYADDTLFGGVIENNRVENWGFRDRLYKPEILSEWVLHPEEWKFAQKWFDIIGWIENQKDELTWKASR